MTRLNVERITALLGELKRSHARLNDYRALSIETILSDQHALSAVKYQLIVAIQVSIDICNHISAKLFSRAPTDYADCFRVLAEEKVIPQELLLPMVKLAKLRNLLIHLYTEVDDRRLLKEISANLDDFLRYGEAIHRYLQHCLEKQPKNEVD